MNFQVFSRYHNEGLLQVISARGRELYNQKETANPC